MYLIYIYIKNNNKKDDLLKNIINYSYTNKEIKYKIIEDKDEILSAKENINLLIFDVCKKMDIDFINGINKNKKICKYMILSDTYDIMDKIISLKFTTIIKEIKEYKIISKWLDEIIEKTGMTICDDHSTKDVIFMEAFGNRTICKTKHKEFILNGNLKYWESRLEDSHIKRIHRSYMININHIKAIKGDNIYYDQFESVPIGRKYKKDFVKLYEIKE